MRFVSVSLAVSAILLSSALVEFLKALTDEDFKGALSGAEDGR